MRLKKELKCKLKYDSAKVRSVIYPAFRLSEIMWRETLFVVQCSLLLAPSWTREARSSLYVSKHVQDGARARWNFERTLVWISYIHSPSTWIKDQSRQKQFAIEVQEGKLPFILCCEIWDDSLTSTWLCIIVHWTGNHRNKAKLKFNWNWCLFRIFRCYWKPKALNSDSLVISCKCFKSTGAFQVYTAFQCVKNLLHSQVTVSFAFKLLTAYLH